LHDIRARERSFAIEVGEMEQQFLRPNEERRLNVKLLSELDNVVTREGGVGDVAARALELTVCAE
jgi:hypothetical protein